MTDRTVLETQSVLYPVDPPPALPRASATFSPCRLYRYALTRCWAAHDNAHPVTVIFIGLNPSIADETKDDPTIRKCTGFAKRWGAERLVMLNLFAWRDTNPKAMKIAAEPVGPLNDGQIREWANLVEVLHVVAAWGRHGQHRARDRAIEHLIVDRDRLKCLRVNADGTPMHPLYVPYEQTLIPYRLSP